MNNDTYMLAHKFSTDSMNSADSHFTWQIANGWETFFDINRWHVCVYVQITWHNHSAQALAQRTTHAIIIQHLWHAMIPMIDANIGWQICVSRDTMDEINCRNEIYTTTFYSIRFIVGPTPQRYGCISIIQFLSRKSIAIERECGCTTFRICNAWIRSCNLEMKSVSIKMDQW